MMVGVLELTLRLPEVRSLKAKRKIVRSVVERALARFRVAVAEVADNDLHQRAVIGVSAVGNDGAEVNGVLDRVRDAVELQVLGQAEVIEAHIEVTSVSFDHRR
jgi:hypothetical protein